ncbi:ECF transporter S component family protein [Lacunimicrobium album]
MSKAVRCQCPQCRKMLAISRREKLGTHVICPGCEHEILLQEYVPPEVDMVEEEDDGSLMPAVVSSAATESVGAGIAGVKVPEVTAVLSGKKKRRRKVTTVVEMDEEQQDLRPVIWTAVKGAGIGAALMLFFDFMTGFGYGWGTLLGSGLTFMKSSMGFRPMLSLLIFSMSGIIVGLTVGLFVRRQQNEKSTRKAQNVAGIVTFATLAILHQVVYVAVMAMFMYPAVSTMVIPDEDVIAYVADGMMAEDEQPQVDRLMGDAAEYYPEEYWRRAEAEWQGLGKDDKEKLRADERGTRRSLVVWTGVYAVINPVYWTLWIGPWEVCWMFFASVTGWFFAREEMFG